MPLQFPFMAKLRLTTTEKIILALVALVLAIGYFLFNTNLWRFELFVQEDGVAEWLTVLGLLLGSLVCFSRFGKLFRKRSWWFLLVTLGLGLFLFFAAGEEISWGQRIFGITTPEYFKEHNAQQETNLHNLIVGGVKINKLIFSTILVALLAIYLIIVPLLNEKNAAIRRFLDKSAIPVARWYQVIGFVLVGILASLIKHDKNPELLECGGALLFFLIVCFPKNKEVFKSN